MKTENNPHRSKPFTNMDFALQLTFRVTLGFNQYKCFAENKKPDWDTIFKGKEYQNI
jgi:hypothetical protein